MGNKTRSEVRWDMEINELEKIISILKQNDVLEFELEQNGTHIRLSRGKAAVVSMEHFAAAPSIAAPSVEARTAGEHKTVEANYSENMIAIESPIVGTFYRRPAPDVEPFVKEGDRVKKGDTLCIVEAMKVMNEIEATCDGTISKILLNDGQVVEYGEVLFLIDPSK